MSRVPVTLPDAPSQNSVTSSTPHLAEYLRKDLDIITTAVMMMRSIMQCMTVDEDIPFGDRARIKTICMKVDEMLGQTVTFKLERQ